MLPDSIGRYRTMLFALPLFVISCYLSVFATDLSLKRLGFMGQGLFHIKVPVAYLHANELVPNKSKLFVMSVITAFDSTSMALLCFGLKAGFSF